MEKKSGKGEGASERASERARDMLRGERGGGRRGGIINGVIVENAPPMQSVGFTAPSGASLACTYLEDIKGEH